MVAPVSTKRHAREGGHPRQVICNSARAPPTLAWVPAYAGMTLEQEARAVFEIPGRVRTDQAFDRQRDDGGRQLALGRGCSLEVSTSRSACQRSWAVCMRSHDAAEVSNTAPSRT